MSKRNRSKVKTGKIQGFGQFSSSRNKPSSAVVDVASPVESDSKRSQPSPVVTEINTALKDRLKQQIVSIVCREGDATFVKLERLEGFKGEHWLCGDEASNAVIWPGVSHEGIVALQEIDKELDEQIVMELLFGTRALFIYGYDGFAGFKHIPMANLTGLRKGYKTPHWVPVLLKDASLTKGF